MRANTEWFSCWLAVLLAVLGASPCLSASSSTERSDHDDRSIRIAIRLLAVPPRVPIEVVDAGRLPGALRDDVKGACAYVRIGVPRIFVNSSCPTYLAAGESLFEAMKLAAILRHEMAHLDGENEAQARAREAITFRELLRRAPADLLTPGIQYAAALERHAAALRLAGTASRSAR